MLWLGGLAFAASLDIDIETVDTELDKGTRLRLEYGLWQASHLYETRLGIDYPATIHLDVTIYGERAAFAKRRDDAGHPEWYAGWFSRKDGRNEAVFFAGKRPERLVEVFRHEGSHFLVSFGGPMPGWLNEGLAEVLESAHDEGSELIAVPYRQTVSFLKEHGGGSVRDTVLDDTRWKDTPNASVSSRYRRAWAITTVLLSTRNGSETLKAVAKAYRKRRSREAALAAIDATYQGGVDGLQRDLDRFAADPPARVVIARGLKGPLKSDVIWTSCPDGRLVRTTDGCGY